MVPSLASGLYPLRLGSYSNLNQMYKYSFLCLTTWENNFPASEDKIRAQYSSGCGEEGLHQTQCKDDSSMMGSSPASVPGKDGWQWQSLSCRPEQRGRGVPATCCQIPAASDAIVQLPLWSVHVDPEVKAEWWFSTLRSLVTAGALANTRQFTAETRWSTSYIAYSHYMDALEAYSLISSSQQVTTGRPKAVVYTGETFVLDLSVGPYVNCLFKD